MRRLLLLVAAVLVFAAPAAAHEGLSHWKVPRFQGPANCTMHNFNTLPTTKRNVPRVLRLRGRHDRRGLHRQGEPVEVGHHDPHGANSWSAYWHDGRIYTNDGGPAST